MNNTFLSSILIILLLAATAYATHKYTWDKAWEEAWTEGHKTGVESTMIFVDATIIPQVTVQSKVEQMKLFEQICQSTGIFHFHYPTEAPQELKYVCIKLKDLQNLQPQSQHHQKT